MSLIAFFAVPLPRADGQGLVTYRALGRPRQTRAGTRRHRPNHSSDSKIGLQQDGDKLTLIRWMRAAPIAVTYPLDGSEVRSRVPGRVVHGRLGSSRNGQSATEHHHADCCRAGSSRRRTAGEIERQTHAALRRSRYARRRRHDSRRGDERAARRRPPSIGGSSATLPAVPPSNSRPKTAATISQLAWLSGVWIGSSGSDERWTPAASGSMLAIGRTMRDGVMGEFEFLCITERNGGLVYQAMPNGRSPATDFTLTHIDSRSATFENPGARLSKSDPLYAQTGRHARSRRQQRSERAWSDVYVQEGEAVVTESLATAHFRDVATLFFSYSRVLL